MDFPPTLDTPEALRFEAWLLMRAMRQIWPARNPFRQRIVGAAAGGAYDEIQFGPITEERFYRILRFAVEDETTAPSTDIRVYVSGHGYNHLLVQQKSPAAATLYWDPDGALLTPSEALVARFTGATAGDRLTLYLEGWWEEPPSKRGFGA